MTNQDNIEVVTINIAHALGFEAGINYSLDYSDVDEAPSHWSPLFVRHWNKGFEAACEEYGEVEIVQNLMSGKDVVQSINTPLCCNVSSETYWSM
jgi:hypothetical protein